MAAAAAAPLVVRGRESALTFPHRVLLAPMEGITDPIFRELVLDLGAIGGALTEFLRISVTPLPRRVIAKSLGDVRTAPPVGVQFMAAEPEHLPASIAHAVAAGAPWIDLNFGCPAPVVFSKCAGSALLDHPDRLCAIIRAAVAATTVPVSAKMRAGVRDPGRVRELVVAAAEAGASMITLHARLRVTSYEAPATWAWIAEARAALDAAGYGAVPLVGNGGIETPAQVQALLDATGCEAVMVGRAALADPWLFRTALQGEQPTPADGARFALRYADEIVRRRDASVALKKLKQMTRWYRCGGIFDGREHERQALLRSAELDTLVAWYRARLTAA